jgi:hypothetical protein
MVNRKKISLPHCFKPGDRPWNKVGEPAIDESSTIGDESNMIEDLHVMRIEWVSECKVPQKIGQEFNTAFNLRPNKEMKEVTTCENIICSLESLAKLINENQRHPRICHAFVQVEIVARYGLGIILQGCCKICGFRSAQVEMSNRIQGA